MTRITDNMIEEAQGQGGDRYEMAHSLTSYANTLIGTIRQEVGALRPMGIASDLGLAMGLRPAQGVLCSIPGDGRTFIFAKGRQPTEDQICRWAHMSESADKCRKDAAELDAYPIVIEMGLTIGNHKALERSLRLQEQGLTTIEEDAFIEQVAAFWQDNPASGSGVVTANGIEPIS